MAFGTLIMIPWFPTDMSGGALTRRQPWLPKVWAGGRKIGVILFYSSAHTPRTRMVCSTDAGGGLPADVAFGYTFACVRRGTNVFAKDVVF